MATVVFDSEGLLLVDIMPHGTTINSDGPELAPCDYHLFGKLKDPFTERVVQNSLETGHKIDLGATAILDKTSGYWELVIKEAIEIQLDDNNFNRDGSLQLSTAWKPAINTLRPPAHGRQSGPATSSRFHQPECAWRSGLGTSS
ncbi:hypothetical protein ANN_15984 [Periplaneta americana]|uniref:Per a allergen n=1 Tax=Periplaneta americana TaxID=6978 RepID=A0ABQ8SI56_PERAM|nr:hypothetical protein ANN_15984 [Periplaneta americana]